MNTDQNLNDECIEIAKEICHFIKYLEKSNSSK
jgi:hypothetical protein